MKHYLRVVCGLLLTMSFPAIQPVHASVVSYTADKPYDLDDERFAAVFAGQDHPNGLKSMEDWPLSVDKDWFADEWQGRDARLFSPIDHLEHGKFAGFLQQWQKQNGYNSFHPDEDWKWQYLKLWLEDQEGDYDSWRDWWQDHKDGSTEVPIPASVWLLGSALGFIGMRSYRRKQAAG